MVNNCLYENTIYKYYLRLLLSLSLLFGIDFLGILSHIVVTFSFRPYRERRGNDCKERTETRTDGKGRRRTVRRK